MFVCVNYHKIESFRLRILRILKIETELLFFLFMSFEFFWDISFFFFFFFFFFFCLMKFYGLFLFLLVGFIPYIWAQSCGCTDPLANNYNPTATINDGSCNYSSSSISATTTFELSTILNETSGLIWWNHHLWTHNDDSNNQLYALDTMDMHIVSALELTNCLNVEWEEISQDDQYIYVGDFGNNSSGNRRDLKILRVSKNSILDNDLKIDTIWFSYSLQTDFTPSASNQTNFDCEAMIVSIDSIYLFTKEWVSNHTTLYVLPKTPGTYIATDMSHYNVQGLITGATYLETEKLVVLVGYSSLLQPFFFLLYDFENHQFFSGNKRKIEISLPFYQIEGVATTDGINYYTSNEKLSYSIINIPAKVNHYNLSEFLNVYLDSSLVKILNYFSQRTIKFYLNPTKNYIHVTGLENQNEITVEIINLFGEIVLEEKFMDSSDIIINMSPLPGGIYLIRINHQWIHKIFKQ